MNENNNPASRRKFLRDGTALIATVSLIGLVREAYAEKEHLDPAGSFASAFGYQHDGSKTDRSSTSQACTSCLHFSTGGGSPDWGACAIFPDNLVNVGGWCTAYTAKP